MSSTAHRVAIIGAGMAGLTCARQLADLGYSVTVYEKSRGLGGRMASRRTENGLTFDHGAQYITARSEAFKKYVASAIEAGHAQTWYPRYLNGPATSQDDCYVGTPAMNGLLRPLARGLDIKFKQRVSHVRPLGDHWQVELEEKASDPLFDFVVCTAPAPQAQTMLSDLPDVIAPLAEVAIAPCWALMVSMEGAFDPGFDSHRAPEDVVSWVAQNASKPGRDPGASCWTVHASPAWSAKHIQQSADWVEAQLLERFKSLLGDRVPNIAYTAAHRWRYAMTTEPLNKPYLCTEDRTLFVGGDWCLGARVESAFESGQAIAKAIASDLPGVT